MTADTPRRSSHYWVPLVVLLGAPLAAAAIKFWPSDWDHGHRNLSIMALGLMSVVVLAFWLLFLSRWPAAVRITPVALLVMASAGFALCVRDFHFTGDMWPVFTFRWEASPDDLLDQDRARQADIKLRPPEERKVSMIPFDSFFGFERQGEAGGTLDDWSAHPPREVWRWRIGGGYAGFLVDDNRAVTIEQRRDEEVIAAYDVDTGKELWTYRYPSRFKERQGGDGPRATPTIAHVEREGDSKSWQYRVIALGALGQLTCLDLESGEKQWSANILENNANLRWGMSGSPFVAGDRVIVAPGVQTETAKGRGVIVYDVKTGKGIWASGTRRGSYSSPVATVLGKTRQVLVFDGTGLTGYDFNDGKELWHHDWVAMPPEGINVAQPLVLKDNRIFISTGYDVGCAMLQLKEKDGKWTVETLWQNTAMRCKFTSPVESDGYLYGLDEGTLVCLDAKNGERRWKGDRYGHGQLLLVDKRILILSEKGDLALVEASPDKFHEIGKKHVLDGDKTWNPPALAGTYAFVRNHLWMACYRLPGSIDGRAEWDW